MKDAIEGKVVAVRNTMSDKLHTYPWIELEAQLSKNDKVKVIIIKEWDMTKEEFILDASMKMVLELIKEWEFEEDVTIVEIAKDCADAATKIWDKANINL